MTEEQPKIIIDSDWKTQAQQEKERLSTPKDQPGSAGPGGQQEAGPIGFMDVLRMMIEPALLYMGRIPDPSTGKAMVSLEVSRLYIDMLAVLEEKTKGNLEEEEEKALRTALGELRADWVDLSKHIAQAVAEGKIKPSDGGGMQAVQPPPP